MTVGVGVGVGGGDLLFTVQYSNRSNDNFYLLLICFVLQINYCIT